MSDPMTVTCPICAMPPGAPCAGHPHDGRAFLAGGDPRTSPPPSAPPQDPEPLTPEAVLEAIGFSPPPSAPPGEREERAYLAALALRLTDRSPSASEGAARGVVAHYLRYGDGQRQDLRGERGAALDAIEGTARRRRLASPRPSLEDMGLEEEGAARGEEPGGTQSVVTGLGVVDGMPTVHLDHEAVARLDPHASLHEARRHAEVARLGWDSALEMATAAMSEVAALRSKHEEMLRAIGALMLRSGEFPGPRQALAEAVRVARTASEGAARGEVTCDEVKTPHAYEGFGCRNPQSAAKGVERLVPAPDAPRVVVDPCPFCGRSIWDHPPGCVDAHASERDALRARVGELEAALERLVRFLDGAGVLRCSPATNDDPEAMTAARAALRGGKGDGT